MCDWNANLKNVAKNMRKKSVVIRIWSRQSYHIQIRNQQKNIDIIIKILRKNNKLNYKEKFLIEFIKKSTIMIIFKLRINFLLHWIIMRLSFFSQVLESVSHQSVQSLENMSSSLVSSVTLAKSTLIKIR